jgi:DNA helicase-2/ATP-dependent DNA helicase PcrA
MANNKISAQQVYATMRPYSLTPEQVRAVEDASISSPSLVVAGAGSGKTELMAVRVVWLVANGFARPEQILGLTFTRKAASELSKRIFAALNTLRDTDLWPTDLEYDYVQPTVTTYNSYANSLYRENALALGLESESTLLTEAAAYQVAREVLVKQGHLIDDRLSDIDISLDRTVLAVLDLAGDLNDNLTDSSAVSDTISGVLGQISGLPRTAKGDQTEPYSYHAELITDLATTEVVANLADAYRREKARLGYVDYSDQVALAERAVREVPGVAQAQRDRFTQVLLDEYQDTSVLQTQLLSKLFQGTSVYAVGDPNQSIYGWRGASAANLTRFLTDFALPPEQHSGARFELSTSWRNPTRVLDLANHLATELGSPASFASDPENHLVPLTLQSRAGAPAGRVQVKIDQTILEETESVAKWLAANYANHRSDWEADSGKKPGERYVKPSAAVLTRNRRNMQAFREAIEAQGLRVEVVGLGGLLQLSEIIDLVAALKVIHDPNAGTELVRLLAGARWQIGPKDLDRLFRLAKKLNRFQIRDAGVAPEDSISLVDALDSLLDADVAEKSGISEQGLPRLVNAAETFARLRSQNGLPLPEFVRAVERELWIDIEVVANPKKQQPMAHLNAFANIVSQYAQSNHRPYLGAFLKWLEYAEEREKLETPPIAAEPGVVQLLTVHASKGLEWDFVVVANLTGGSFPSEGKNTSGWLGKGKLPYPLRGDSNSLPVWNYRGKATQKDLKSATDEFKSQMREHTYREELRLVYVAVTRPKTQLLLTASYWTGSTKKPNKLSSFLLKAAELPASLVEIYDRRDHNGEPESVFAPCESDVNPLAATEQTQSWPLEPLGGRHGAKVREIAELVRDRAATTLERNPELDPDLIDRLLRERTERARQAFEVEIPVRINASSFKDYLNKPAETAAKMLRPVPEAPFKATRAGTLFHSLMEAKFASWSSAELSDAESFEAERDLGDYEQTIEALEANFAASRWAKLQPLAAELEIQLAVDSNIYVCKLDAVFEGRDGSHEIVDWKTGAAPKSESEIAERALQLELYRLAYATARGLKLADVTASLFYVAEGLEIQAQNNLDAAQLRQRWAKLVG